MKLNSMMSQELPIKVAPQTRVGQVDEDVSAAHRNVSSSMSIHRSLSSSSDESSASSSSSSSSVKLSSSSSLIEEDSSPIFDVSNKATAKQQTNKKPGQQITDDEEDDEDEDFVMSEVVRAKLSFHEDEEEESSCTLGEPPSLQPPPPPAQQEETPPPAQQQYTTLTALKCHALYKIQEKIRSGGFGDVYKGVRKIDHAPIAIKIIRKDKINSWTLNVRDSGRGGEFFDFLFSTIRMTKLDSTLTWSKLKNFMCVCVCL